MPITLTSPFDLNQEVYALINNKPTKCVLRIVKWPPTSVLMPSIVKDESIQYGLLTKVEVNNTNDTLSLPDNYYHWRKSYEIGISIEDLFKKLNRFYQKQNLKKT